MSNDRELKIVIKADGSVAVNEIKLVGQSTDELEKQLKEARQEMSRLAVELERMTGTSKGTDAELKKLKGDSSALTSENKQLRQEIERVGAELTKATANVSRLEKEMVDLGKSASKSGDDLKKYKLSWADMATGVNQAWEAIGRTRRLVAEGWDVAKQGAKLREAQEAFDDYAWSVGKSSEDILSKLAKASGGTIDRFNLIKTASLAMSLGVTKDSDKMANLLEIARNKARLFGIETQQAFEDIVTGIGRASPKILDNLGIRIPAGFEEMTESMSDTEKVAKLFELTLEEGNKQLEEMGGLTDSSADKMRAFEADISNLKSEFGLLIAEGFGPYVDFMKNDVIPITREFIKVIEIAGKAMGVPSQIAGTLYYDQDNKKYPDDLEEARQKYYEVNDRITEIVQKIREGGDSARPGPLTRPSIGANSYQKELQELQKYSDELEMLIVGLDKAREKAAEKGAFPDFSDEIESAEEFGKDLDWIVGSLDFLDEGSTKATKSAKELAKAQKAAAREADQIKKSFSMLSDAADKEFDLLGDYVDDFADDVTDLASSFGEEADEIVKSAEEIAKALKELEIKRYNSLAKLDPNDAQWGLMDLTAGGLLNQTTYNNRLVKFQKDETFKFSDSKDDLSKTIAEAVSTGFANADFSNFSLTLGNILTNVLSKSVSNQFPVLNAGGGVNLGNLGINLAASAITSFITRPGRFFGGTEIHGQENVSLAQGKQTELDSLWDKLNDYYYNPLVVGAGMWNQLKKFDTASRGGFGYQGNKSGDGIFSDKTITYELLDFGGSQAIKNLNEFMRSADSALAATDYLVKTFQANQSSNYYSELLSWYDQPLAEAKRTAGNSPEAAQKYFDLQFEYDSLKRELASLKTSRADRGFQIAMEYGGYIPGGFGPGSGDSVGPNDWLSKRDWYGNYRVDTLIDRDNVPVQPLVSAIDSKLQQTFDLAVLNLEDPEKYLDKYSEFLEKQRQKYEDLAKFELEIVNDMTAALEEREAAMERYSQAQSAFYQTKLDQLEIEKRKEAEIERELAEQSMAKIEAGLSLVGELNRRGDKILILQGGDTQEAIDEMMNQFADNPEMIAILQKAKKTAEAKAIWG
ncbi:MAG: hypothetical protein AB1403_00740 [Candidatus Riflebacteria bacterium]